MKLRIGLAGKGFVGDAVARRLNELGYELEITSLSLGTDFTKAEVVEEFVKRNDLVIQMFAIADLNHFEEKPLLGMNTNVWSTVLFANYCSKYKKRLCYISTACVYGNTPDLPSNEESRCNPSEIYAEAKLAGEHIIKGYAKSYDLNYLILRIATVYGPEMRSSLAPAVFLGQILSGEPVTIHGSGDQTRTLTYIDDVADGIVAGVEYAANQDKIQETINISSEEELSVRDWVRIICEVTGKLTFPQSVDDRKGQTYREYISSTKAMTLLNWRAKHSFKEGIEKTYKWMVEVWDGRW